MKKKILMALFAFFLTGIASGQAKEEPDQVVETTYMMPKRGMADKFETAVSAHNKKYHPEGPHVAVLRLVDYGDMAGWYVWVMGITNYAAFDSRPAKGAHDDDWTKNIDPLVEKYGPISLFKYEPELSTGMEIFRRNNQYQVWKVKLAKGERARFVSLINKVSKAYASTGTRDMLVYSNLNRSNDSPDYGLIWSFKNYAEWGSDWALKAAYEKMNGAGSWDLLLADWDTSVESFDSELRTKK